ncbi:uncharacterized protein [Henckelia pumila]|uniref:uncharacterized protein isoform X2 n=1 Tax=Henckelia pumila TaxID=405737 RepID=UPI003C6DDCDF
MAELCLMASHGFPLDLGVALHSEPGFNRFSKGSNQVRFSSRSFDLSLHQKEDWNFTSGLLDRSNLITLDSTFRRPAGIQGFEPSGFGIADKCNSQEKILKLLASGSMGVENGSLDMSSMIHDLMGHLDFAPFTQQSLIYPTREVYFNEPSVEYSCNSDGQLQNYFGNEMNDVFKEISGLYSSKNTNKSSKQTMLVPFFERRKRAQASTTASNLLTEKAGVLKSHEKVSRKASEKKKSTTRTIKEREKSYLHMCEILLSILVNKEQKQTKNTIHSLKKSSPRLPAMLTQCSATIAGAGIAVVLSVLCRVACNSVPFCASKILSTVLGLGLISLSWAVHKLRDTVVSIRKTSGKMGEKEGEMMNCLERNMKDIYYRGGALMVVAVLRLV